MQLIRYYNRYSWIYYYDYYYYWNSYGYCCDTSYWRYNSYYCRFYQCDNYFDLCIRSYGSYTVTTSSSTCTYGRKVTPIAGDDSFSFSTSYIGESSSDRIDNPVIFTYTGTTAPVSAFLKDKRGRACKNKMHYSTGRRDNRDQN